MRKLAALLLVALALPGSIAAQIRPTPGPGDPRLQTVAYDASQVVQIQVASGYQVEIDFAQDERIENVAVGDSLAWQATPNKRGDRLFVKAVQPGVTTNMTVVTDARGYAFELVPAYGAGPDMPFVVRFVYPAPAAAAAAIEVPASGPGRYAISGARMLRPASIDDDGVHTFIVWPEKRPLPAIFAIDAGNRETLVNGAMRDGRYVIDGVADRLRFRIDRKAATATRTPKLDPR